MFCSEVLSDDLHIYHVSLCVYVIRCLCFQSCCYLNTCVRVDEAWGCPAHKNKSNVEIKWFSSRAGNLLLWLIENASYRSWHSPPAPGRWLCGRRPAWCRRPGWRTWGRQWWSPVCLLKPGEKKKTKNVASNKHLRPQPPLPRSVFSSLLTSENFPSPNHCSHLMPWLACRLPVARHVTTMPGHQEKPLIFPHTSSPMPKPLLSWKSGGRESEDEVNPSLPTK